MPWKISIFFYLSLGFSLCGLIFPTHVSQAIGFDVGDMVYWVYGFYILFPRNPVGEPRFYFSLQIQGVALIVCTILLLVASFVALRKAKHGDHYEKNLIYAIAIIQLIASQIYQASGFTVMRLSMFGFLFSATFALIGSKELNLFYIHNGRVFVKIEKNIGLVLIIVSLISIGYAIWLLFSSILPYVTDAFSLPFVIDMIPGFIFSLLLFFYGIISLMRGSR